MRKKRSDRTFQLDEDTVLSLITSQRKPLRTSSILRLLHLPSKSKKILDHILHDLQKLHKIIKLQSGFWTLPAQGQFVTGIFHAWQSGGGRIRILDPDNSQQKEIFISPFQTGGAWHNDIVRVNILGSNAGKGRVVEIIERQAKEIPCILEERRSRSLFFKAADGRIPHQFIVRPENMNAITMRPGDLANLRPLRKLDCHGRNRELWEAEILRNLGPADRVTAQEDIVKLTQQVPGVFPRLALAQAEGLPPAPSPDEFVGREDLREIPFVTIDGADAKDFDDAIHVEKTPNFWVLKVAIADVSHYVRPDATPGSLDAEAYARGNSWYFPRSVEPMLPKKLSNGLCSLKPGEDRLAMVVEIAYSHAGAIKSTRFFLAVMRSAARLIYDDVGDFFNGNTRANLPDHFRPMLNDARQLYELLFKKRRKQGTIDFSLPEPAYEFEADGKLKAMRVAQRNDANMLIEEFMIAANEAVAEFLQSQNTPVLFRDHAAPEQDKLRVLYNTLKSTALEILPPHLEKDGRPDPAAIQEILASAHGTPWEYVVNRLCLRSMAQARYDPRNIGHFGLASRAYCHFTSPIRRYADLLTHRALKHALGISEDPIPDHDQLLEMGSKLNGLERKAIDCEREIAKRLACLALEGREGEIFNATVSGVADFGLFVEFENMPAEGLIRIEELGDEWYMVDKDTQSISAPGKGTRWQLGQPIKVAIKSVELDRQEIRVTPILSSRRHKGTSPLKRKNDSARKKHDMGIPRKSRPAKPARKRKS